MDALGVLLVLAAIGLVVVTGRTALPLIVMRLQPRSLKVYFEEDVRDVPVSGRTDQPTPWPTQLAASGFFALGRKVEQLPLWGPRFAEAAYATRDARVFAALVLGADSLPVAVYLYTPLHSGGMVFTRNFAAGKEFEANGTSVRNVVTLYLQEMLDSHESRLRAMERSGQAADVQATREGRIRATHAFYASDYYRRSRAAIENPSLFRFALAVGLLIWVGVTVAR